MIVEKWLEGSSDFVTNSIIYRVVKMRRRPALSPATLRFSPAVNCWRKAKNRVLKKSCKVENRIEKEIVFIMP